MVDFFKGASVYSRLALAICVSLLVIVALFGGAIVVLSLIYDISIAELLIEIKFFEDINLLRFFLAIQTICIFGVPPIVFSKIFSGKTKKFLLLTKIPRQKNFLFVVLIMIVAIPFVNFIAEFNKSIIEFLWGAENSMKAAELELEKITKLLFSDVSFGGLFINIIVIALLPAVCEELFFRGAILNVFVAFFKNNHLAIIATGVIFSVFHWQFYGFLPRALMGVLFGYFAVYNKSLWLPIVAHFINNVIAVLVYFFINKGLIDESYEEIGSNQSVFIGMVSGLIFCMLLLYYFRNMTENSVEQAR